MTRCVQQTSISSYTRYPHSHSLACAPQVRDLLKKMTHPGRQTLLFSATMPTAVAEFARAGLKDPEIIRLDAENKISDKLEMEFIRCWDDGIMNPQNYNQNPLTNMLYQVQR